MFVQALKTKAASGAIIRLGNSVRDIDLQSGRSRDVADYARFQVDAESALALNYPTDLSRMTSEQFNRIARHGFEVADATLCHFCPQLAPQSMTW